MNYKPFPLCPVHISLGFRLESNWHEGGRDQEVLFIYMRKQYSNKAAWILISLDDQSSTNMLFFLSAVNENNRDVVLLFPLMLRVAHSRSYTHWLVQHIYIYIYIMCVCVLSAQLSIDYRYLLQKMCRFGCNARKLHTVSRGFPAEFSGFS